MLLRDLAQSQPSDHGGYSQSPTLVQLLRCTDGSSACSPNDPLGKGKWAKLLLHLFLIEGKGKFQANPPSTSCYRWLKFCQGKLDQVQGLHWEWLLGWGFLTLTIKSHIQAPNFLLADCYALIFSKYTASASCWVYEYIVFELLSTLQVGMAFFVHDKSGGGQQPKPECHCKESCSGYTSSTFPTIDHCLNKSSQPFETRLGTAAVPAGGCRALKSFVPRQILALHLSAAALLEPPGLTDRKWKTKLERIAFS